LVRSTALGAGPGRAQRIPSVAAADVVIVVVDSGDGRLLRGRRTAIDPGVVCDQVGLLVPIGSLILGYQPRMPVGLGRVMAAIEEDGEEKGTRDLCRSG